MICVGHPLPLVFPFASFGQYHKQTSHFGYNYSKVITWFEQNVLARLSKDRPLSPTCVGLLDGPGARRSLRPFFPTQTRFHRLHSSKSVLDESRKWNLLRVGKNCLKEVDAPGPSRRTTQLGVRDLSLNTRANYLIKTCYYFAVNIVKMAMDHWRWFPKDTLVVWLPMSSTCVRLVDRSFIKAGVDEVSASLLVSHSNLQSFLLSEDT